MADPYADRAAKLIGCLPSPKLTERCAPERQLSVMSRP